MTSGEISLLIGLIINAMAMVLTAWLANRKLKLVAIDVLKIEKATNSMKDELVAATSAAAFMRGDASGRIDLKAEQKEDAKEETKQEAKADKIPKVAPLPVADERTAKASEQVARATERSANALERAADNLNKVPKK